MTAQKQMAILETKRLILRSLRLEDAQRAFDNWTSDKDVAKFMCWDTHSDIEITKEWIKECSENIDE